MVLLNAIPCLHLRPVLKMFPNSYYYSQYLLRQAADLVSRVQELDNYRCDEQWMSSLLVLIMSLALTSNGSALRKSIFDG
jgi:hypothetical protein